MIQYLCHLYHHFSSISVVNKDFDSRSKFVGFFSPLYQGFSEQKHKRNLFEYTWCVIYSCKRSTESGLNTPF